MVLRAGGDFTGGGNASDNFIYAVGSNYSSYTKLIGGAGNDTIEVDRPNGSFYGLNEGVVEGAGTMDAITFLLNEASGTPLVSQFEKLTFNVYGSSSTIDASLISGTPMTTVTGSTGLSLTNIGSNLTNIRVQQYGGNLVLDRGNAGLDVLPGVTQTIEAAGFSGSLDVVDDLDGLTIVSMGTPPGAGSPDNVFSFVGRGANESPLTITGNASLFLSGLYAEVFGGGEAITVQNYTAQTLALNTAFGGNQEALKLTMSNTHIGTLDVTGYNYDNYIKTSGGPVTISNVVGEGGGTWWYLFSGSNADVLSISGLSAPGGGNIFANGTGSGVYPGVFGVDPGAANPNGFGGTLNLGIEGNATFWNNGDNTLGMANARLNLTSDGGNVNFNLGANLDTFDRINGGGGTDTVNASFSGTKAIGLNLNDIDALNFLIGAGANVNIDVAAGMVNGRMTLTGSDAFSVVTISDYVSNAAGIGIDASAFVGSVRVFGGEAQGILGAAGNDILEGGYNSSNVVMNGKLGNDILTGGSGNDDFTFDTELNSLTNVDTITDFGDGADRIMLDPGIFAALGGSLQAFEFNSGAGGAGLDADDRIYFDTDTGNLYYDANGWVNGLNDGILFATLATTDPGSGVVTVASLSASQIFVIT